MATLCPALHPDAAIELVKPMSGGPCPPPHVSQSRAWVTVNKESGGGKKNGSGR
ncbi:MAG: hypothetical protein PVSMB7_03210 [Chloroflexota bacterium]